MNPTLRRLEAMDAQRFDLSKCRRPLNLIICTSAPCEKPGISQITTLSPESSPSDDTLTTNEPRSPTDDSTSSSPTVVEATVFTHKNDVKSSDTFERDGYTTTRTIIRPTSPRSPLLSVFSRPSSPIPDVISRPISPLCTNLGNLNCMGTTNTFEEELDFILQHRENDPAGVARDIKVKVTQKQAVFYEEKWRDAIQALLYERTPPVVSCVGHIHPSY